MAETNSKADSTQENFICGDKIYILGPFDRSISKNVIPGFVELIREKMHEKKPEIEIYINSHGGYAEELMAMLAMISIAKKAGIRIVTYNIGYAYSCGSILAIHGDHRKMYRYADNVAHLGCSNGSYHTFEQLDRVTSHSKEHFNNIVKWYVDNTKMTKKQVEDMLKDDNMHLNADKCLKYGFCDEII